MKPNRCGKLDQHPFSGDWYRAVELKYYHSRLSTDHSRFRTSRFKAITGHDSHRVLYLAENHQLALFEVGALLGPVEFPISDPRMSWLTLSLRIRLGRVADLSDEGQRAIIGTTHQELTGIWSIRPAIAPTQALGEALYRVPKIEGFLAPSARGEGRVLVIFPDKIDPQRSSVAFRNDLTGEAERLA